MRALLPIVLASVLPTAAVPAADNIHWTITGPNSVSIDWRGTDAIVTYGRTRAHVRTVAAVSQAGTICDPAAVHGNAATGPYMEAKITGLKANTRYHYKIGAGGADHTFRTPPRAGSTRFDVMVEGDVGDSAYYPNVAKVQRMIASDLPRLVLVVGDLTYKANHRSANDIKHFNDVMVWSQDAAYMPIWGNHEWEEPEHDDLRNYKGRFDLPNPQSASPNTPSVSDCGEDWYWFDYGNTRFIAYPEPTPQTGSTPIGAAWTSWFEVMTGPGSPMAAAQNDPNIRFIVTFGHRPAYSSGYHPGEARLAGYLDTLGCQFDKYVLNLSGHSHNYERTFPQLRSGCSNAAAPGVVHLTVGTGGSDSETDPGCRWDPCVQPSWSASRYLRHGIVKLSFTASAIEGKFLCGPAGGGVNDVACAQGDVIDAFTLKGRSP